MDILLLKDMEDDIPESCSSCGRFFKPGMMRIGLARVCVRCASSGHEAKLPQKKRYRFGGNCARQKARDH